MMDWKNVNIKELSHNRMQIFLETSHTTSLKKQDRIFDIGRLSDDAINEIMNCIVSYMDNPELMANNLHAIVFSNPLCICEIIINSSIFPQILSLLHSSHFPLLMRAICDMVYFSPTLIMTLFRYDFFPLLYGWMTAPNMDISHEALKFIRKIIPYGMENKIILFATGFIEKMFSLIHIYNENEFPLEKFRYAIKTVFLFVVYDPVYGENSFFSSYGKLHDRKTVMENCRSLGFPTKVMFKVSQFLKYGNGFIPNRELYHFIDNLLISNNFEWCLNALHMLEYLASYSRFNSEKIAESTNFFKFAKMALFCNNADIVTHIYNIIHHILFYTDDFYEKQIQKIDIFRNGLNFIGGAPSDLQMAISRCLFNGLDAFDFVKDLILIPDVFECLLNLMSESENNVRSEICALIVATLSLCTRTERGLVLSDNLIFALLDFLPLYDESLTVIILFLFVSLFDEFPEQMYSFLATEDTIDVINHIIEDENEEAAYVARSLLKNFSFMTK